MKTALLAACTLFLFACSESTESKDPIQERNETLQKNFTDHINAQFSAEEKQIIKIDSIEIVKVDTLTQATAVALKMKVFTPQFNEQIKLVESDVANLTNAKAFNYDEQTLNQLQEKFNEDNRKMEEMGKENNEMLAALDKADDKKFKCYLVSMKIHTKEKGVSRVFDTALPADKSFKPIDIKNL